MLKIKIPFGFKTISFDSSFVVYSGKIRVKASYDFIADKLKHVDGLMILMNDTRQYVTISYVVLDYTVHVNNICAINNVLRDIMIERIDNKYRDWSNTNIESIIENELPF